MKKLLLAGIAAAAFCGAPALAADMPVKAPAYRAAAPYDPWTGCYIGANAGGGWAHEDGTFLSSGNKFLDSKPNGFVGGGQLGCDYQSGSWVGGVRGLFDWSDMKDTSPNVFNSTFSDHTRISYFGTATARLGYLVQPNTLLYVNGGFAWARNKHFETDAAGVVIFTSGNSPVGGTVGAGLEWILAPSWSLFVEYYYLNFGTKHVDGSALLTDFSLKQNVNAVLVGLNYRFGSFGKAPVSAKY